MKKLNLFLIIIMITTSLSGCKAGSPSTPVSPDGNTDKRPVEITVVTSYGGDDGNRQNYERAYQNYEVISGNIVRDNSAISNEEWKSQVMNSFQDGTEPDILFYFTGADSNKIVQDAKVVSIEEIRSVYPDYASNMKDEMLPVSPFDGKNYAVPVNGYWEGLYVNKKVLANCGVSIPDADTTWDEFLTDCRKIADKGYIPIAASLYEVPHYWFEFCLLNNGGIENHAMLPQSSSDSIGQNWIKGINDIKLLYTNGFFPPTTLTDANAKMDALMIDDKAAFMIDGSWKMGWFAENASDVNNFTVTYVPGKNARKSTDIIGGISMGYFITKKAWDDPEKREACVEFVEAMTTDEVVATFGVTAVTALKEEIPFPADANNLIKDALYMVNHFTGISAAAGDSLLPDSRNDLFSNIRKVADGSMTAKQAVDRCLAIQN